MVNGYLSSETRSMIPTIVACLACVQLKEYPLNIIDIPSMLIEHDEDNILKIVTHREVSIDDVSYAQYEFRFEDNAVADQWYQQICEIIRTESDSKSTESNIDDDIKELLEQKVIESNMKNGQHPSLVSAQYLQEKLKEREERLRARGEYTSCIPPPIPPPPPKRDHKRNGDRIILCNYD